jgi:hypothetical protein
MISVISQVATSAISLAWDTGARYIWFQTYDCHHHLPHFCENPDLEAFQSLQGCTFEWIH